MSTPLAAVARMNFSLTVDGYLHRVRQYCMAVASGTDPSGYELIARPGYTNVGVDDAINRYFQLLAPIYHVASTIFNGATLETLSGGAWLPVVTRSTIQAPTNASANKIGTGTIVTMRDTAFHKVKAYLPEPIYNPPSKSNAIGGFDAGSGAFIQAFTVLPPGTLFDPVLWARGRSDLYLGSYISIVSDTNDKFRRHRGLA